MPEVVLQRQQNLLLFNVWFEDVPGYSQVKMRPLNHGRWWFDLVRVGDPQSRGRGLGSRVLDMAVEHALVELEATNIGLEPHALERLEFDLAAWYRRHGFVHARGKELWLRPLNEEGAP